MNIILNRNIFFLLIILFSSFFLIFSYEEIFNENHFFQFSTSLAGGKKYGVFILEGNVNSQYILSAYSDFSKEKRIQLGQSFKGKIQLYLSLKGYQDIYMGIECPYNHDCSGTVYYSFTDIIELIEGQPISYYVNEDNE